MQSSGDEAKPALKKLGWNDALTENFRKIAEEGWEPARVVGEEKGFYRLLVDAEAEPLLAEISGKMRHGAISRRDYPAVGDWVACKVQGDRAQIRAILPRASILIRKEAGESSREQILATNVDTVFIMTSANQDFNPRRLERYLTIARDGGTQPVVLLNKIDLVPGWNSLSEQLAKSADGVPIHAICSKTGEGFESLLPYLEPGRTAVLLGSSGVGKSTLTNRLLGREKQKTREVRAHDDRGVHTTTSRSLIPLPTGALLIDTPGLRELQLTETQEEGLQASFTDIEELGLRCKFSNCRHENEPGCTIQAALADGSLPSVRWEAFRKLQREIESEKKRKGRKGR